MIAAGAAFVVAWALTAWFAGPHAPFAFLDRPSARSLHTRPVPRTGGIALLIGAAAGLALAPEARALAGLLGPALLVALVSFWDDWRDLPPWLRLPVHLVAAGWTAWLVLPSAPVWVQALAALAVAWAINLYNFMDGMDGFAGGMTMIGFGAMALAMDDPALRALCLVLAAAAAGFLVFNFPPARIFMGDVGSATLGLLAAGAALAGIARHALSPWLPLAVFAPFWLDATLTLLRRLVRREPVWRAHRKHAYQRLVASGWGHRRTVLVEWALMLAGAAVGFLCEAVRGAPAWIVFAAWIGALTILYALVDRRMAFDLAP